MSRILPLFFPVLFFISLLSGCGSYRAILPSDTLAYTINEKESPLQLYAPQFYIQAPEESYNRIGGVIYSERDKMVLVDPEIPTIYGEQRSFIGDSGQQYSNFVYRVHFQGTPLSFLPFYLGAGENIGLLIIVTVNGQNEPVLYTSLHTCGCYLAFIPTSYLAKESLPSGWQQGKQNIYGETLPGMFEIDKDVDTVPQFHVQVRAATHRIMDAWLDKATEVEGVETADIAIKPMRSLKYIETGNSYSTSFFESGGSRTGYVKRSQKIWERLFISWWVLDYRVGEDKYLGQDIDDGPVFYTSLKPWAREASDLRDFSGFLHYWGFRL